VRRAFAQQSLVVLAEPVGIAGTITPADVEFFGSLVRSLRSWRAGRRHRLGLTITRVRLSVGHITHAAEL